MTIRLYDTREQRLRDFAPLVDGRVGFYVCGPTVQSSPHIGHLRSALAYDLWRRWFEHRGYDVTFVRNVTDIDDKILANATDSELWWALAYRVELEFSAAYRALGKKIAGDSGYTVGTNDDTVGYSTPGANDDFTYGELGVASMTIEVGGEGGDCGGFFPSYSCVDDVFWKDMKPAFITAAQAAAAPYKQ